MTKEFKVLLYSNFMYWISKLNLKIGEFEAKAGMTPGYLSKLQKDESKGNNILDFMVNASKILGVSIDSLVSVDFSSLTKTEKYFADFIDKVIRDTTDGKLNWCKETTTLLQDFNYQSKHPLFKEMDPGYGEPWYQYNSLFDINVNIGGECYYVNLVDSTLYLMNVYSNNEPFGVELYFVKNKPSNDKEVIKICQIETNSPLESLGGKLNSVAKESANHIHLNENAKSIIDDFMNDIPF